VKALGLSMTTSKSSDLGSTREQIEKCLEMLLFREHKRLEKNEASLKLGEKLAPLRDMVRKKSAK